MLSNCFYGGKGSITETLVFRTIQWYSDNNIAYFKKSYAPSLFNDPQYVETGDIDFYGVYKGKYISFEVKETEKNFFYLSKIQKHQLEVMEKIQKYGGLVFLIINFHSQENNVWIVEINKLQEMIKQKVKKLEIDKIHKFGMHLPIKYPGIIDWLSNLNF